MPSNRPDKPELDVWDTCCLLGVLNNETDKVPALLAQTVRFESKEAVLGIPSAVVSEIYRLSDGSAAQEKVNRFLDNAYVELLQPTREVSLLSGQLQFRFTAEQIPDLKQKAIAARVPANNANRLRSRDSEVLATAIVFKATRLTTYDPFLIFIGREYITAEYGLIIDVPSTSFLPFPVESTEVPQIAEQPVPAQRNEQEQSTADEPVPEQERQQVTADAVAQDESE